MDILKLEILTADLGKTEKFYREILGFQMIEKSEGAISFLAGSSILTFKLAHHLKPVYHFAFNIPANQLDEAFTWAQNRLEIMDVIPGHKIADFVNWNAKSFYFYDSNGNILEFIARYDLNNDSEALFTGASIICISEIGIATDDVAVVCDALIRNYNLSLFSRQPRLPNFTALGDNHGLLILSGANRHWYPTDKMAGKWHTRLEVRNNDQLRSLSFNINSW